MGDFQQNTITNRQAVLDYIDANSGGGGGSQDLESVLTQGASTGGIAIISPDTLTELTCLDTQAGLQCTDGISLNNGVLVQSNEIEYFAQDFSTSDETRITQEATNISLLNTSSNGNTVNQVAISQTSISSVFATPDVSNTISVSENSVNVQYNDVTNDIFASMFGNNSYVELNYINNTTGYQNRLQILQDEIKLVYDNQGGALDYEFRISDGGFYLKNVPAYADDAAASALPAGTIFQTDGTGAAPLNVAGLLMIKQ